MASQKDEAGFIVMPRRFALSVLWTVGALIMSSTAGAALVYHRIGALELSDTAMKSDSRDRDGRVEIRLKKVEDQHDRIIRIEEQVKLIHNSLSRIENKLYR